MGRGERTRSGIKTASAFRGKRGSRHLGVIRHRVGSGANVIENIRDASSDPCRALPFSPSFAATLRATPLSP